MFFTLLYSSTLLVFVGCGSRAASKPGATFDAGAVFFSSTPKIEHVFEVTNTTGQAVHILGEKHSCTCTAAEIKPGVLEPGESTSLKLSVSVPQSRADRNVSCLIKTDQPTHPEWEYKIAFRCYPEQEIEPPFIGLEAVSSGDSPTSSEGRKQSNRDAGVTSPQGHPSAWLQSYHPSGESRGASDNVVNGPDDLDIRIGTAGEIKDLADGIRQIRYPIFVSHKATDRGVTGRFNRSFLISSGGGKAASATLTWNVVGNFSVVPGSVYFGLVGDNSKRRKTVLVTSNSDSPFRILKIETGSALVKAAVPTGAFEPAANARRYAVEMTMDPSQRGDIRSLSGTVKIHTDLEGGADCTIPYSAFFGNPSGESKKASPLVRP